MTHGVKKGELKRLKENLVEACQVLYKQGLMEGFGHVSIRILNSTTFLIPRRMSPALVTTSDIITMNLKGEKIEGEGEPNSESFIHSSVYQMREAVFSVVHTHSPMAIVLGICGQTIIPRHHFGAMFIHTPLYTITGLIKTAENGMNMVEMLGRNRALLLRGHGAVVVGESLEAACLAAIYLEETASFQVYSSLLGGAVDLSKKECRGIEKQIFTPRTIMRAWEYYTRFI